MGMGENDMVTHTVSTKPEAREGHLVSGRPLRRHAMTLTAMALSMNHLQQNGCDRWSDQGQKLHGHVRG
jgi:hypothetical protein